MAIVFHRVRKKNMNEQSKLKLLPISITEGELGVYISKGYSLCKVGNLKTRDLLDEVLKHFDSNTGASIEDVLSHFEEDAKIQVKTLIELLINKRFLCGTDIIAKDLSYGDNFTWQFGVQNSKIQSLDEQHFTICASREEPMTERLIQQLLNNGFQKQKIQVCYGEDISNTESPGILIALSSIGDFDFLINTNSQAIQNGLWFLPIFIDRNFGGIGPLVTSEYDPCFECFKGRINSCLANFKEVSDHRRYWDGKHGICNTAMLEQLSSIAAFEIYKYLLAISNNLIGKFIELDFLNAQVKPHKFLKVPRCPSCSSVNKFTHPAWVRVN